MFCIPIFLFACFLQGSPYVVLIPGEPLKNETCAAGTMCYYQFHTEDDYSSEITLTSFSGPYASVLYLKNRAIPDQLNFDVRAYEADKDNVYSIYVDLEHTSVKLHQNDEYYVGVHCASPSKSCVFNILLRTLRCYHNCTSPENGNCIEDENRCACGPKYVLDDCSGSLSLFQVGLPSKPTKYDVAIRDRYFFFVSISSHCTENVILEFNMDFSLFFLIGDFPTIENYDLKKVGEETNLMSVELSPGYFQSGKVYLMIQNDNFDVPVSGKVTIYEKFEPHPSENSQAYLVLFFTLVVVDFVVIIFGFVFIAACFFIYKIKSSSKGKPRWPSSDSLLSRTIAMSPSSRKKETSINASDEDESESEKNLLLDAYLDEKE